MADRNHNVHCYYGTQKSHIHRCEGLCMCVSLLESKLYDTHSKTVWLAGDTRQDKREGHGQPAETKISYLMDVLAHVCVWLCRHHVIIAQLKGSHYYLNENASASASVLGAKQKITSKRCWHLR